MHPNILLIVTDQQTSNAMSCAGNERLSTPAMDRIANAGVRFETTYCTQPLCVPSRMSMMTGRMPREVGVPLNMHPASGGIRVPMLGQILAGAGYDRGYVGKWHLTVPREETASHGFDRQSFQMDNNVDPLIPDGCKEFLSEKRDRPFFLTAMFVNPHDICEWARGDRLRNGSLLNPPSPEECPPLPGNFEIASDEPSVLRQKVQPSHPAAYPTTDWTPEKWRQYLWAYYRMTEMVDTHIARVLDALDRSGQAENTIVIFASDHGDGAAEHRWNQKQALFESTVRVPFMMSGPGIAAGRVDREHLVSLGLDLLPTICDYAGVPAPEGLMGRSLRPLAEGRDVEGGWRDCVFAETSFGTFKESFGVEGRMARTARHKYVAYSEGEHREQLFDMEKDPGEMNNLAARPDTRAILDDHRRRLAEWPVSRALCRT